MGATCYMNVVLQSFIHNPLLRNFFLSDRHNSSLCTNRENCLACELDLLFNEVRCCLTQPQGARVLNLLSVLHRRYTQHRLWAHQLAFHTLARAREQ